MSGKKKLLVVLLCLLILAAVLLGLVWHMRHYVMIDLKFYPSDPQTLDLREENISISHHDKIIRRLPDSEVLWNIPFQEERYPQETKTLTVSELTKKDISVLAYFEALTTLDARDCTDYALLQQVKKTYPQLEVRYQVSINGTSYPHDAAVLALTGITEEELALLEYLPALTEVQVSGSSEGSDMESLKELCQKRGIAFLVMLGGEGRTQDTTELQLESTTDAELELLSLLPNLTKVHIKAPQAQAQTLLQAVEELPKTAITWEKEVFGMLLSSDTKELDLTAAISEEGAKAYEHAKTISIHGERDETTWLFPYDEDYPLPEMEEQTAQLIATVQENLAYFPNMETLFMGGAILDNEAMAAFREEMRESYKVVWTVRCGSMVARTDTPYFMPTKYHVYYFQDHESDNLKYCEDMICVDLGHMAIKHIEWAAYMPKLQYLILAHSDVRSIEPLRNCKELKFLEVDSSAVKDFSPLLDCTKLEDLNVGDTYGNFEVIQEMTWLKNLWMVDCSRSAVYKISQALPDVHLMASGSATVANGWRELPNYYAMRDIMNMYYMEW